MKKSWITLIVVVLGLALAFLWGKNLYNKMVEGDEAVTAEWAKVETQYQRRADLIPNLVNTVKGYTVHERETLEAVITARSKATGVTIDPTNLNEQNLAQFQEAQDQLSSALSRLLVVVEQYPDLKASEQFKELQAQLEGTENRIAVARDRFNEVAKTYNVLVRRFPNNMIASLFGFSTKAYFKSHSGAENSPEVKF